jgi:hypothetical protein
MKPGIAVVRARSDMPMKASTKKQKKRPATRRSRSFPPDKVVEVEDFIDFLRQRQGDRQLTRAASKLGEQAFEKVWDNAADAAYDHL